MLFSLKCFESMFSSGCLLDMSSLLFCNWAELKQMSSYFRETLSELQFLQACCVHYSLKVWWTVVRWLVLETWMNFFLLVTPFKHPVCRSCSVMPSHKMAQNGQSPLGCLHLLNTALPKHSSSSGMELQTFLDVQNTFCTFKRCQWWL